MRFTDDEIRRLRIIADGFKQTPATERAEWNARVQGAVKMLTEGYPGVADEHLASFAFMFTGLIEELSSLPPREYVLSSTRLHSVYSLAAAHFLHMYDAMAAEPAPAKAPDPGKMVNGYL